MEKRSAISSNTYIRSGLGVSLLFHVAFAFFLSKPEFKFEQEERVLDVSYEPPSAIQPRQERQQIVSPADKSLEIPPKDTNKLSDRDSAAEKEQVRKGDNPDAGQKSAGPTSPQKKQQEERPESKPKGEKPHTQNKSPVLKTLSLDADTLQEKFSKEPSSEKKLDDAINGNNNSESTDVSSYRAFSRPSGSGAAFLGLNVGTRGTMDFLPNLPDGDITLLNAKANRYAVFVRRVATQVFAQLRLAGWDMLRAEDIFAIRDYTTVYATLSPKGVLLNVRVETGSGSARFDEVVSEAVNKGARDPNPPLEAATSDGNIHFIFKAKSWSRAQASSRTGAPFEQRWLMLATGLE